MSERGVRGIGCIGGVGRKMAVPITLKIPPRGSPRRPLEGCRSQFCYSLLGCGVCDVLFGSSVDRDGHKRGLLAVHDDPPTLLARTLNGAKGHGYAIDRG